MAFTNKRQLEIVRLAKTYLSDPKGSPSDLRTAVMMIRDLPATIETGNSDLVWAMYRNGALHKNDIMPTLEELEKYLIEKEV